MTGSSGSRDSDGDSFSGGSGGSSDQCTRRRRGPINSPKSAVLSALGLGSVLGVEVRRPGPSPILTVVDAAGTPAGSLTFVGYLELIECIENRNFKYKATITSIAGGSYEVRVDSV